MLPLVAAARLQDLETAVTLLSQHPLPETTAILNTMIATVRARKLIDWETFQTFFERFEAEAQAHSEFLGDMWRVIEGTILSHPQLQVGGRAALIRRALLAPAISEDVANFRQNRARFEKAIRKHPYETDDRTLLFLLGHVAQWQILDDLAKEWVGHWGSDYSPEYKDAVRQLLLCVNAVKNIRPGPRSTPEEFSQAVLDGSAKVLADSSLYRHAIAHSGFLIMEREVSFWTRDASGKRHDLPPLSFKKIESLYDQFARRLDLLEAFARVTRAYGRHAAN